MKIGVVHGRFQPLHKGHLEDYLRLARKECDHLIVGITNPDPTHTLPDLVNIARTTPQNNPLTYYERLTIIQAALLGDGYSRDEFHIVPFPINFPQLLRFYLPENCTHFLTIFDEWGRKKEQQLKNFNLNVEVLTDKDISEKSTSATEVRERILKNRNWKDLVPSSTHHLIESYKLQDRIRRIKELSL